MAFFTSSDDAFYSLKAEKADAIRKFHQQQNLFYFGRLLGASLLLLWSFKTLPFLTQMASAYVSVFGQQLCAFLVANAIVIFVYHFSTAAANNTIAAADNSPSSPSPSPFRSDIYDEYVSLSSEIRRRPTLNGDVVEELPPPVEILPPPEDHAAAGSDLALTEPAAAADDGNTERRHRRTRSVVVESTTATEGGGDTDRHYKAANALNCEKKELRRSETVVVVKARKPAAVGKSLSFNQARKSIEEMNNDEFNMTVESFIATKKRLLRDENIALFETDYDRRHVFAVAACPR